MQKLHKKYSQVHEKVNIYPHYHCGVCSKMIEKGSSHVKKKSKQKGFEYFERFCSQECYDRLYAKSKTSKIKPYLGWIIGIAVIVIFIIVYSILGSI